MASRRKKYTLAAVAAIEAFLQSENTWKLQPADVKPLNKWKLAAWRRGHNTGFAGFKIRK
tara:strand:- start:930 stop:1109 length:180 start_codon:yes stop_codon:yes gene_type:complete